MNNQQFPKLKDVEEAVLGALLLESTAIEEVAARLHPDLFYETSHQAVCKAVLSLYENHHPIDMLTVLSELQSLGLHEKAGGPVALVELTTRVNSSHHIGYHVCLLQDKYLQRQLVHYAMQLMSEAVDDTRDVGETLENAVKRMNDLAEAVYSQSPLVSMPEAVERAKRAYEERERLHHQGLQPGISTGMPILDELTGGWQKSFLSIIAARPGMGKTAMTLWFAARAADQGVPVLIFSLEMATGQLTDRMALRYRQIPTDKLRDGSLDLAQRYDLYEAYDQLRNLPVTFDDSSAITVREIRGRAAERVRKGQCGLIIIDYLQLLSTRDESRMYNREQQVAQLTRQLKIMAKDLNVPVIVVSQLSRNSENRTGHKPYLSDLRESGAIEQDADTVLFVHRQEYYHPTESIGIGNLILAKNRHGATEEIDFYYNKSMTQIEQVIK